MLFGITAHPSPGMNTGMLKHGKTTSSGITFTPLPIISISLMRMVMVILTSLSPNPKPKVQMTQKRMMFRSMM